MQSVMSYLNISQNAKPCEFVFFLFKKKYLSNFTDAAEPRHLSFD